MARVAWNDLEAANGIGGTSLLLMPARRRRALDGAFAVLRNGVRVLKLWQERMRQRSALAELDERFLRDLGITRYDAEIESGKPFWR